MQTNDTHTIATNDSCDNIHQCRTLFQIIWSCVSVLIACTWVAIHPNVPSPREGVLNILATKIGIMIVTLIAPEIVVLWAARQWFSARELAKRHRDKGWSVSHGFLFLMGGFARYRGENLQYVLRYIDEKDLRHFQEDIESLRVELCGANPDDFKFIGSISRPEIRDRSHSDGFAKFIAVGQTAWFVVQLLARKARRLPITELEIMTVAFAAMSILIYFFWWDKPLGVGCHIRLQEHENVAVQMRQTTVSIVRDTWEYFSHATSRKWMYSFWKQLRQTVVLIVRDIWEYLSQSWDDFYGLSRAEQWDTILEVLKIVGQILTLPFWIPIWIFGNILFETDGALDNSSANKIPSFARTPHLEPSKKQDQYIAYGAAILFGAIHCIAWAFAFPSTVERVSWRIASVIVTCAPLYLALLVYVVPRVQHALPDPWDDRCESTLSGFGFVLSLAYILSRITLIVLPFLALRDLPTAVFENVEWTSFIPHI
ncbi:hypothetical protein GYMLUDRAFT_181581 [Collybiopsis luxurians FD-317 M1]|uniref:Uncharacterized protein n=1 Tax=Collybiopsis luxurians FD-317 M1 TaxID=944289 RepID=A0A0D0BAJ5_9AGAR|nr:hypothetical protein GYMLUDRAFT_181581 [Collybiopsis luxurians FD-317 M1]